MQIGNQTITREQMPSFVDFSDNPRHLYGLMQDQLMKGLSLQGPAIPIVGNNPNNNSSQWNKNNE